MTKEYFYSHAGIEGLNSILRNIDIVDTTFL